MKPSLLVAAVIAAAMSCFVFDCVFAQPRLIVNHRATINRFTRATLLAALSNATFEMRNVSTPAGSATYTSVTGFMSTTCTTINLVVRPGSTFSNSTGIGIIRGQLDSTPFAGSFSDSTICNITTVTFRGYVVSTILATASNTSVFPPGSARYISQVPSVNSLTAPTAALVRSGSIRDFIIGVALPTSATQGYAVLKLESLAGGICSNITAPLLGGIPSNASVTYTLSSNSDGCRLYLDQMVRLDFPGVGAGLVNKTNTIAYLVAGNPSATTGSPALVYRSMQSITFSGTNLPRGAAENPAVSVVISGVGSCVSATIPCAITSYGVNSITCLADLRGVRGNDTAGGCRISARITRLGITTTTATNVRCPDIPVPVPPTSGQPFSLNLTAPASSVTIPQLNSALSRAYFDILTPSTLNLFNCTMFLNVSGCATSQITVTMSSCVLSNGHILGSVAASPVAAIPDDWACQIMELNLHVRFCNLSAGCLNITNFRYTNLSISDLYVVNHPPTVNALTKASTRIGGIATTLVLTGTSLPRTGEPLAASFSLESIAGGSCNDTIDEYSLVQSDGTTATLVYTVSLNNDGCRISLTGIWRGGVPATGLGLSTGTNVIRDFLGGNPVINYGTPEVINRTVTNVTLTGSSLPLGPEEGGVVSFIPVGDSCSTAGNTPISCTIFSYGSFEIQCTANLALVLGDDLANGGCLLNAYVTRLGARGPEDSTGIHVPWYGEAPADPPPIDPPVAAPTDPPILAPTIVSGQPQEVSAPPTSTAAPGDANAGNGSNQSGGGSAALIGGIVGGAVGLLLIAALVAVLIIRSRSAPRPKSIEMESPFEEPRYFSN